MIKMTAKGLAKYIATSPAGQRKVLQEFKYPSEDESFAMRLYYKPAKDQIKVFHRGRHERTWLQAAALSLLEESASKAAAGVKGTAHKLEQNARALQFCESRFGGKGFEVLPDLRFRFACSNVSISVAPDLHLRDGSKTRLVKVNFGGRRAPSATVVNVVTQCLYHAAVLAGQDVSDNTEPTPDDAAWASHLYPKKREMSNLYGTLSGEIINLQGKGVGGVHVRAVRLSDVFVDADGLPGAPEYSVATGATGGWALGKGEGSFVLPLPAGRYALYIEPITKDFVDDAAIGPFAKAGYFPDVQRRRVGTYNIPIGGDALTLPIVVP